MVVEVLEGQAVLDPTHVVAAQPVRKPHVYSRLKAIQ
jgi:hypothetical protein